MDELNQICATAPASIASIVAYIIVAVGYFNNLMPSPDKIENPVLKLISRITHFIGTDIVTSVKK